MSEYQRLISQIQELQQKAEAAREAERLAAIATINNLVSVFALQPTDIKFSSTRRASAKPSHANSGKKVAMKYADSHGNGWSGRGKQPRWLMDEVSNGAALESFRI